jgi:hypothetical protein
MLGVAGVSIPADEYLKLYHGRKDPKMVEMLSQCHKCNAYGPDVQVDCSAADMEDLET